MIPLSISRHYYRKYVILFRYLAIDETDRMMEKGHFQELHNILEKINANPAKLKKTVDVCFFGYFDYGA